MDKHNNGEGKKARGVVGPRKITGSKRQTQQVAELVIIEQREIIQLVFFVKGRSAICIGRSENRGGDGKKREEDEG